MPILQNPDGSISYTQPLQKLRSEATGTVVDEQFAICDNTNVLKQVQFRIVPLTGGQGTLTLECDVSADTTLNLTALAAGTAAAGNNTEIQFNSGAILGADSNFTWNSATKILKLGTLEVSALKPAIVLLDNQASPTEVFNYDYTAYPFAIIEFSLIRDSIYQAGRMIVATNGVAVGFSSESAATVQAGAGITFTAAISGANVQILYASTASGFNSSFKYSIRRWA